MAQGDAKAAAAISEDAVLDRYLEETMSCVESDPNGDPNGTSGVHRTQQQMRGLLEIIQRGLAAPAKNRREFVSAAVSAVERIIQRLDEIPHKGAEELEASQRAIAKAVTSFPFPYNRNFESWLRNGHAFQDPDGFLDGSVLLQMLADVDPSGTTPSPIKDDAKWFWNERCSPNSRSASVSIENLCAELAAAIE